MNRELNSGGPAWPPEWLVPDWPAPANVRAVFTTRQGGISNAPWDSMNLGDHVGDTPAHVSANRALLAQATGVRSVFLQQVHGSGVVMLDTYTHTHAHAADGYPADACVATHDRLACTIMVADCLPVLLCTEDGSVVAAAHAGWRGLAGSPDGVGVLESVHAAICASFKPLPQAGRSLHAMKIIAWLGPCIGPGAFEVGPEVKTCFEAVQPASAECFSSIGAGKYLADLPGLARLRLQALGITQVYGNDGTAPWCTAGNPSRFFSHRRDTSNIGNIGNIGLQGNGLRTTGRMAAAIWRE